MHVFLQEAHAFTQNKIVHNCKKSFVDGMSLAGLKVYRSQDVTVGTCPKVTMLKDEHAKKFDNPKASSKALKVSRSEGSKIPGSKFSSF